MQRFSSKRDAILDNLRSRKDHPTADMIYDDIRKIYPDISMGTVYRNLSDMCDTGLIIRLGVAGKERYDGDISLHTHFFCESCGKVCDVFSPLELSGLSGAEKETGAKINRVSIAMRGLCSDCQIKSKNQN